LATNLTPIRSSEELAKKADVHVSCICYFGGDPSPQMPHALRASEIALRRAQSDDRIMRICWETNGYMKPPFAKRAAQLSLKSGGCLKFDLKAWDESLHKAMCGVSNKPSLDNFKAIGEGYYKERPDLPILTASTLLVPGYVDAEEVGGIAEFIAEIDPRIPYTLLAFYPTYVMNDLPTTSRRLAEGCYNTAKRAGLERVRIGNIHLLH
ncbi:MAG: radical SAM protein, partial [Candidatus Bathyarchaeia archaeon]